MGWTFNTTKQTKRDFINEITTNTNRHTFIAKSVRGNNLWTLVENNETKERGIVLFMLSSRSKCWGYKDISEDMGPLEWDCPKSFIELASPTDNEYALNWRSQVLNQRVKNR